MNADLRPPAPALPAGLRDRVLAASLAARPFGRAVPQIRPAMPVEAFTGAADRLSATLGSLAEPQWQAPVIRGLTVQGLAGHLTGVEEDLQRALAGDPAVANADHVASTQPAADRQAGRPPGQTLADWRASVAATLRTVSDRGDLAATVVLHRTPLSLGDLLVARSFELWAHDNDIRQVTGRPLAAPDPATLVPMAALAAALLPFAVLRAGHLDPVDLRLVLTGPGGGGWDLPLGQRLPAAGPAMNLLIVADVVGFCRLVSNRITPRDLDPHVIGDPAGAKRVLAAAATLALD